MPNLSIGTRLMITDGDTVFEEGEVTIIEIKPHLLVCKIVKQPTTEKFKAYKAKSNRYPFFALSSHVFVRDGQYAICANQN